jgi:hypothetical protein
MKYRRTRNRELIDDEQDGLYAASNSLNHSHNMGNGNLFLLNSSRTILSGAAFYLSESGCILEGKLTIF